METTSPSHSSHREQHEPDENTSLLPAADAFRAPNGVLPHVATGANDSPANDEEAENPDRPKGIKFAIVFACILMGDFFVGYDTSCVTTLTPVITDEFHAIDDLGWYGISYILASASTILIFGQMYTMYPMKAVFLASFLIFAVGTAISASATSSAVFIVGRAVSGLGSAGVFSGGNIIVANTTPLKRRPIYQALAGGVETIALALGPFIAGAIADSTSWRFSFYIMIPVAACIIAAVGFFVQSLPRPQLADIGTKGRLQQLDLLGVSIFIPMIVCLILSLQWGGTMYDWADRKIIALLVVAGVLSIAFVVSQAYKGDKAIFPLHLLSKRSVALGVASQFCIAASLFIFAFYLPIYFQAVRGASPFESGIMYLPSATFLGIGVFVAGPATSFIGYYTPMMIVGTTLISIGAGLMTTFRVDTPASQWIWYQILYGLGNGLAFQQSYTAVQTVLEEKYVATAIVCLSFMQELGGIVALAVVQNVFLSQVVSRLQGIVPGLQRQAIINSGIVDLPKVLPVQYRDAVYEAYTKTIVDVFSVGLVFACITICAVGIEWKSVKDVKSDVQQPESDEHD